VIIRPRGTSIQLPDRESRLNAKRQRGDRDLIEYARMTSRAEQLYEIYLKERAAEEGSQ